MDAQKLLKLLNNATAKLVNNDYAGAIADCDQIINPNPDNPDNAGAYNIRGAAKEGLEQYDDATSDFNQAIKLNPKDAKAYNNRGTVKAKLGEYNDAIPDFNQAIKLNPKYAKAYYHRGLAKARLKQHADAITDFNQAITLNPQYAEAYNDRGITKAKLGKYNDAITDLNQAITLNPQYAAAYHNRGNVKTELKQFDDAIADYDTALRIDPTRRITIHDKAIAEALKESDALQKEVTAKFRDQIEKREKEYEKKILDPTPYSDKRKECDKEHKIFRGMAFLSLFIFILISGVFVYFFFGSEFWLENAESPYKTIPIILASAFFVGTPMTWLVHVLLREAAKHHALKEDAFTKERIILFISVGHYDDKTRYRLVQRFITYHERQSSAHLILNTKPPSIPQKSGFDAITLKNLIKSKNK